MATITKTDSNEAAYSILNYYHGDVVEGMKKVIDTAKDLDEFKIVSDLLRGTLEHLLATHGTEDHQ